MFPTKETVSHSEISPATRVYFMLYSLSFLFVCLSVPEDTSLWIQEGLALQSWTQHCTSATDNCQDRCHNSFVELFRENSLIYATLLGSRLSRCPQESTSSPCRLTRLPTGCLQPHEGWNSSRTWWVKDQREGRAGHTLLERLPGQGYWSHPRDLEGIQTCRLPPGSPWIPLGSGEGAPLQPWAAALPWRVLHPRGNSRTRSSCIEIVPSLPLRPCRNAAV